MSVRGRGKVLSYSGVLTTPQAATPANMVVKYPLSTYSNVRNVKSYFNGTFCLLGEINLI